MKREITERYFYQTLSMYVCLVGTEEKYLTKRWILDFKETTGMNKGDVFHFFEKYSSDQKTGLFRYWDHGQFSKDSVLRSINGLSWGHKLGQFLLTSPIFRSWLETHKIRVEKLWFERPWDDLWHDDCGIFIVHEV